MTSLFTEDSIEHSDIRHSDNDSGEVKQRIETEQATGLREKIINYLPKYFRLPHYYPESWATIALGMIVIDQTDRDNIVRGYFEQENIDPTRQNELRNQIEEILLELQSLARETLITSNLAPELINWAQKLRAIEQEFEQAETDDNDPFLLGERKDRAEEEIERLLRTDPELTNDLYKILQPEEDLETWYFKDYLKIFTNRAIRKCDFNPEQVVALLEELLEYFSNHDHEQEYDFGQIKNKLLNNKRIVSSGEYMSVSYSLDSLMKFFSKWIDQGLFKPNTEKFITACREIIDELKTPLLPDPEQATGI